jgi:hypothetical protein
MCILWITVEWLDEPQMNPLPQVFKPHTHKLYILRHCTYIVDIDYFDASFVIIIQGPGWFSELGSWII